MARALLLSTWLRFALLAGGAALLLFTCGRLAYAGDGSVPAGTSTTALLAIVGFLWTALQAASLFVLSGMRGDIRDIKECLTLHEGRISRLEGEHNALHGKRLNDRSSIAIPS